MPGSRRIINLPQSPRQSSLETLRFCSAPLLRNGRFEMMESR